MNKNNKKTSDLEYQKVIDFMSQLGFVTSEFAELIEKTKNMPHDKAMRVLNSMQSSLNEIKYRGY